jgi:tetratricopeptide (TPR) repeat protein/O-antigen ligase
VHAPCRKTAHVLDSMKIGLRRAAGWVAERELLWLFVAAPWLLFPELFPSLAILALVAVPLLWLIRALARRPLHVPTPMNLPSLLLLLSLGVAVVTGPFSGRAISGATTVVLGVALVSAFANGSGRWRGAQVWSVALTVGGSVFAFLALAVTDYPQGKISVLGSLAERLPMVGSGLRPGSAAGLDPNQVSGILILLLPVALGFAFDALQRGKQPLMSHWQVYAGAGFLGAFVILFALVLSQSRTALVVLMLVGAIVLGFRSRLVGVLVVALFVTIGMLLLIGLFTNRLDTWMCIADGLGRPPGSELTAWSQRVELWQNALLGLRDYPLTGAGIGTFMQVASVNYPFEVVTPDSMPASIPNLWLQAGVDLGLLGIVAFAWLTAIVVLMGWKIRSRRNGERILLTGFWFGLIAWMGHGLVTGLWVAERPGLLVWTVIGILLGGWLNGDQLPVSVPGRKRLAREMGWAAGGLVLAGVFAWLFLSPIWSLNRGAHLLDWVLTDSSLETQERERLLTDAQSFLDQSGDLPGATRRRALVDYELGNDAQAVTGFRTDPNAEAFLYSRGSWLLAETQLDDAERLLGVAVAAVPDSARLSCLRADVLWTRGDPFAALENYRHGLVMDPALHGLTGAQLRCHKGFAILAESLGWWDEAAGSLAHAAESEPGNLDYQRQYGWALFKATGEIGEPVAIEEAALRLRPDSVATMVTLIDIYLEANRPQKALEWSQTAVDADDTNPQSWLRLAVAYGALEEFDQARNALSEVLRLDPENHAAMELQAKWQTP